MASALRRGAGNRHCGGAGADGISDDVGRKGAVATDLCRTFVAKLLAALGNHHL